MTLPINPKEISWVNPTQATNPDGSVVAWNAAADLGGIQIAFDGTPAVSIPINATDTKFALTTLAAYEALGVGSHTATLAVVTKEGAASPFSDAVTFLRAVVPMVPTSVAVS
jgi:hypothetical protein